MAQILVVDDDREWFARCESAVSGVEFEVRLVTDECDARAAIRECAPDLVFVGAVGTTALSACLAGRQVRPGTERARAGGEENQRNRRILWILKDSLPDLPVVLCSAEGDLSGSDYMDVAAFLHKFADPAEIVGTVARVLGRSRGILDHGDALDSVVH